MTRSLPLAAVIIAPMIGALPTGARGASVFGIPEFPVPTTVNAIGQDVASGDVDNDGDIDIAADFRIGSDDKMWIYLNDGDGNLVATNEYTVPLGVRSSRFVDLNNDTFLDLVVTSAFSNTLTVLLGNGDGTFQAPVVTATSGQATAIDIADVDGDGDPDIGISDTDISEAQVFLNDGAGNLSLWGARSVAPFYNEAMVFADVNSDGRPDLGLSTGVGGGPSGTDGAIVFYLNLGGVGPGWLGFDPGYSYPATVGNTPGAVAAADFDGQNGVDFAVANLFSDSVVVLLNDGAGGFLPGITFPGIILPTTIRTLDFDDDGDVDIITNSDDPNSVNGSFLVVIENLGGGAFGPSAHRYRVDQYAGHIALDDFDGDGFADAAFANLGGTFSIARGLGANGFPTVGRVPVTKRVNGGVAIDLTGDGNTDLVFASQEGDYLAVYPGDGSGDFSTEITYPTANAPTFVRVGDVNNDTLPDVVVKGERLELMLNTGSGVLAAPVDLGVLPPGVIGVRTHVLVDMDNDTDLDIVVSEIEQVAPFRGEVFVLRNDGAGVFTPDPPFYLQDNLVGACVAGDFNGDGWADIAVTSNFRNIAVVMNDGAGSLSTIIPVDGGAESSSDLQAADVDGDTFDDLICPNSGFAYTISVIRSNGDGTFAPLAAYPSLGFPYAAQIADLNDDGSPDVVFCSTIPANARYKMGALINDGTGAFTSELTDNVSGPYVPVVGDLDADGDLDIACGAGSQFEFGIFYSIAANLPTPPPSCAGDITGDGFTNSADFNILASHFGNVVTPFTSGDLTGDGLVNSADFNILAGDFGCGS